VPDAPDAPDAHDAVEPPASGLKRKKRPMAAFDEEERRRPDGRWAGPGD